MKIFIAIYFFGCVAAYFMTLYFAISHKRMREGNSKWTTRDTMWLAIVTFGSWISFLHIWWCHYQYVIKGKD